MCVDTTKRCTECVLPNQLWVRAWRYLSALLTVQAYVVSLTLHLAFVVKATKAATIRLFNPWQLDSSTVRRVVLYGFGTIALQVGGTVLRYAREKKTQNKQTNTVHPQKEAGEWQTNTFLFGIIAAPSVYLSSAAGKQYIFNTPACVINMKYALTCTAVTHLSKYSDGVFIPRCDKVLSPAGGE